MAPSVFDDKPKELTQVCLTDLTQFAEMSGEEAKA